MSTDDWRAVDWPKNQVERIDEELAQTNARVVELDQELAGTDKAVATHNDRISRLERNMLDLKENIGLDDPEDEELELPILGMIFNLKQEFRKVSTTDAGRRISRVEERLARLEGQTYFETSEDNDRIKALEATIRSLVNRLEQAEARMNAYGVPESQRVVRSDDGVQSAIALAEELAGDSTLSARPTRGLPPGEYSVRAETMARITGVQAMRREQFQRGLSAGAEKALENAERSIRRHMHNCFSEGTIEDVVRAMRAGHDMPSVEGP